MFEIKNISGLIPTLDINLKIKEDVKRLVAIMKTNYLKIGAKPTVGMLCIQSMTQTISNI